MKFWKHVLSKPGLWIAAGAAIGVIATASVLNRVGISSAQADPVEQAKPIGNISTESMAALRDLDASFASLVDFVEPAVVHIRVQSKGGVDQFGRRTGNVGGEGSGVIIRPDGWILTNDHVVGGMDKVTVVLNDGRDFPGTVRRANDEQNDIAVVKIDAANLPTARLGDSSKVKAGQFAIAIGSPFGLENSVTIGHISALGRMSQVQDQMGGGRAYSNMIQTDAPINPGNSGGPLINIDGEVIGVNTSILGGSSMFGQGGNVGIGFAIPSNQARLIAEMLIEKGKVIRAYMGVQPENLKEFEKKDLGVEGGAILRDVPSEGPAAAAGIKKDDIVVRIGTYKIQDQQDLRNAMFRFAPGESVPVEVVRNKETKTVTVKLADVPKQATAKVQQNDGENGPQGLDPREFFKQFDGPGMPEIPEDNGDVPPVREGKAKLGVQVAEITADARKEFSIPAATTGVVVLSVQPGSVAQKMGLKAGDVIESFDGKKLSKPEDLVSAMSTVNWGDTKSFKFSRFGKNSQATQESSFTFK